MQIKIGREPEKIDAAENMLCAFSSIFVLCNRIINSGTNDNNNNKLPL